MEFVTELVASEYNKDWSRISENTMCLVKLKFEKSKKYFSRSIDIKYDFKIISMDEPFFIISVYINVENFV